MRARPYRQACENNKRPILAVIRRYFPAGCRVLEIGSDTAQHIRFFAEELPEIIWQPSDVQENLATVKAGLEGAASANILAPMSLDVRHERWPVASADGVFSANTLHIMAFECVRAFFRGIGQVLAEDGYLCVYGPFKYNDACTTASNERFDLCLKQRDPRSGIRNFEDLERLAKDAGLRFVEDHQMPANNQLLAWRKVGE